MGSYPCSGHQHDSTALEEACNGTRVRSHKMCYAYIIVCMSVLIVLQFYTGCCLVTSKVDLQFMPATETDWHSSPFIIYKDRPRILNEKDNNSYATACETNKHLTNASMHKNDLVNLITLVLQSRSLMYCPVPKVATKTLLNVILYMHVRDISEHLANNWTNIDLVRTRIEQAINISAFIEDLRQNAITISREEEPKTLAGFLRLYLDVLRFGGVNKTLPSSPLNPWRLRFANAFPYFRLYNLGSLSQIFSPGFTRAIFVRHPFERLASAYKERIATKGETADSRTPRSPQNPRTPWTPQHFGVRWNPSESVGVRGVRGVRGLAKIWSPMESSGVQRSPTESSEIQWSPGIPESAVSPLIATLKPKGVQSEPEYDVIRAVICSRHMSSGKSRSPSQPSDTCNGSIPSFEQFLRYILLNTHTPAGIATMDYHWQPYSVLCQVCKYKYNFIGKYEMFNDHFTGFLKLFNLYDWNTQQRNGASGLTTWDYQKFYFTLPDELICQLIRLYEDDFRMFNYRVDDYINRTTLIQSCNQSRTF